MALSTGEKAALELVKAATRYFTGQDPDVVSQGEDTVVRFTPSQAKELRLVLEGWLDAPAGNLKVAWLPVVAPIVVKKSALWATLFAGSAFMIGRLSGRKRK